MKISSKARYGLASVIYIARFYENNINITISKISEELSLSKIYLEQVFSLLKQSKIVLSVKGAQGGYRLAKNPKDITVFEILHCTDANIFEKNKPTLKEDKYNISKAMQINLFDNIDKAFEIMLNKITVFDLLRKSEELSLENDIMYYI